MAKPKAQKKREGRRIRPPKQPPKDGEQEKPTTFWKKIKKGTPCWRWAWRAFVVFSVLLGVYAILYPRPMVSPPTSTVDNDDPFSVSFDIYNDGFLPLYDCGALVGLGRIGGADTHLSRSAIYKFKERLTKSFWLHHNLTMDERFTIVLSDLGKGFEVADIAIVVSYNPWFLPFRMEKLFRFVTFKQRDGKTYWRSWPLDEPLSWIQD